MDRITGVQLFIRIVETGSFSKASVDLGVTQPTATKHVAAVEARLGARLLNRNTRGVSATEIGALYYEKCKTIQRELEEADNLASLLQSRIGGQLRISTSVAFGRRVLTPIVLAFMRKHPEISIDLSFDDRYVNLVEQGVDVAIRMGRLADSSLGARYLAQNPWVLVASPGYLKAHAAPRSPADAAAHPCLIYSTVQGDERWHFTVGGQEQSVPVRGPLRTNNLSVLLGMPGHGAGDPAVVRRLRGGAGARGRAAADRVRAARAGDARRVSVTEAAAVEGQQFHRFPPGTVHGRVVEARRRDCMNVTLLCEPAR
jgi:DNA-binding transcriptional LysR family regulator